MQDGDTKSNSNAMTRMQGWERKDGRGNRIKLRGQTHTRRIKTLLTIIGSPQSIIVIHYPGVGDIGLVQPGLPGGAFGALLQGPGKEVAVGNWPHVVPVFWDHMCKHRLTRGIGSLTVWDMWMDISAFVHDS